MVPVELERHGLKHRGSEDKASRTEPYMYSDLYICNGCCKGQDGVDPRGHKKTSSGGGGNMHEIDRTSPVSLSRTSS